MRTLHWGSSKANTVLGPTGYLEDRHSPHVDLTLRATKAKRTQHERLKEFARRKARLERIRKKRAPAARMFYGSILPAVKYGVELVGMTRGVLNRLNRAALRANAADIPGGPTQHFVGVDRSGQRSATTNQQGHPHSVPP